MIQAILKNIYEFILVRSHMNVQNVARDSIVRISLKDITVFTLVKVISISPACCVAMVLKIVDNLRNTLRLTLWRKLSHVHNVV